MKSSLAARDPAVASELSAQAEDAVRHNRELASKLRQIAEFAAAVHAMATAFSQVKTLEGLAAWHEANGPLTFIYGLTDVFAAMGRDARRRGDESLAAGLTAALGVKRKLDRTLRSLNRLKETTGQARLHAFKRNAWFSDPAFHRWLGLWARALTSREQAAAVLACLEALTAMTKMRKSMRSQAVAAGSAVSLTYASPKDSALWYLWMPPEVFHAFGLVADAAARGSITCAAAIEEALKAWGGAAAAPADRAIATTQFLEHLLQRPCSPTVIIEALEAYRRAIDDPSLKEQHPRVPPTKVPHFAIAFLRFWRHFADARVRLRQLTEMIAAALVGLDESVAPRLVSDLHFAKARANENLGVWDAKEYETAVLEYRAGLSVEGAKGESDARGRALGDLANTLQRLPADSASAHDQSVAALYEQALRCSEPCAHSAIGQNPRKRSAPRAGNRGGNSQPRHDAKRNT